MDDRDAYLFLRQVKYDGNISKLVARGYTYAQLARIMDALMIENYIEKNIAEHTIVNTKKGKDFLSRYEEKLDIKKYSRWVMSNEEFWSKPRDIYEIYIPKG